MPKLNPSKLLSPSETNLQLALENYSIYSFKYEVAKNGVENTTVFLTDTQTTKEYVLRIYRKGSYTNAQIEKEIAFINYLYNQKTPVPQIIKNQYNEKLSNVTIDQEIWQYILMEKITGDHLKAYTVESVTSLAETMAKFHMASLHYEQFSDVPKPYRESLLDEYDLSKLSAAQQAFFQRARDFQIPSQDIPHCLIHTDITRNNTLFLNDKVSAILDFEGIEHGYCAQDIATTLWGIIRHIVFKNANPHLIKVFFDAYTSVRSLKQAELDALPNMLLFRTYVLAALDLLFEDQESIEEDIRMEAEAPKILATYTSITG